MEKESGKKQKERIINYVELINIHLEIADNRLFKPPYLGYPEAVGMVFRWSHTSIGDASDADTTFVKAFSLALPKKETFNLAGQILPIKVYHQFKYGDEIVSLARIELAHSSLPVDSKLDGVWLVIVLYLQSATRY